MHQPISISGLTLADLTKKLQQVGKEEYRAKQIFSWIYKHRVQSFEEMTNLSRSFRAYLEENFYISRLEKISEENSPKDGSKKFLFRLEDGKTVETVLLPQNGRLTQCVSSQVGCAMACNFCNTGDMGLLRNLKTHEIIDQVLEASRQVGDMEATMGNRLSNIVYMGMGEPLHNINPVVSSVSILTHDFGFGISKRKITVSTSGLVTKMKEFGKRCDANLAVSLNATTDEVRTKIMPINKRWPISSLLEACRNYPLTSRRRITFEYVMLKGVNDTMEDAKRLPLLLQGIPAKINLIPYNPHPASTYERPLLSNVKKFQRYLLDKGMNATIRISKGRDILAACGQLRTESLSSKTP